MTSWNQIKKIPEFVKHLHSHYHNHLPINIRELFAYWIEQHFCDNISEEQYESYGKQYISNFIKEIQSKIQTNSIDFETKNVLNNYCNQLSITYQSPYLFIKNIKEGIRLEKDLLEKLNCRMVNNTRHIEIENLINKLKISCKQAENLFEKINQCHEQNTIECQRLKEIDEIIESQSNQPQLAIHLNKQKLDKKDIEKNVQESLACIVQMMESLISLLQENNNLNDYFQEHYLDSDLKKWLRCQQLAGNGASMESGNLEQLQIWSESLVDCILHDCRTIDRVQLLMRSWFYSNQSHIVDNLTILNQKYTCLLVKITQKTFIIEKQPPQVMKTNTRFTSTVRLLVGVKISLHMCLPSVEVSIISEAQANTLVKNKDILGDSMLKESAGEILNNRGLMEFNPISNHLSLNLRNMQLKKIRRTEKKGTESVMDEKFSLLFVTKFKIGDQLHTAWTLSLPVVAVVHGNQEPHAWATVTWDNAFADPNRLPFVIPDRVVWTKVGEVLSTKFKNSIFKGLNKENLKFLAGKVFRNTNLSDYDQAALSWSLFSKEALPDQSFTFWEWFYALFKLTKDHLTKLWQDDLITFISKKHAEDLLIDRPPGTFLLRFSDSELGGVSVCFRDNEKLSPFPVVHVQPFTSNDLKIKGLADRVYDIKQLTHLYPDRPKDIVFKNYYTQSPVEIQSNGYVKPELVTQIPRLLPLNSSSYSNDTTDNKSNINEFSMLEYQNGNNFSNLPGFNKFLNSTNNAVPNSMDHCPDLSFLPSINDEDLVQF